MTDYPCEFSIHGSGDLIQLCATLPFTSFLATKNAQGSRFVSSQFKRGDVATLEEMEKRCQEYINKMVEAYDELPL